MSTYRWQLCGSENTILHLRHCWTLRRWLEAAMGCWWGPQYYGKCPFYFNCSFFRTTPTNQDLREKAVYFPSRGRPNTKPLQPLNFYLRRKRKNPFYSELCALQHIKAWFSIWIFIYSIYYLFQFWLFWFSNLIKKTCQCFFIYIYIYIYIYMYINNYSLFFFLKIWLWYSVVNCEVFADVNAIYFTSLWRIMNVWSSFETSLGKVRSR